MVFSTRALVASGVAAGVGGCVGGFFSFNEFVKKDDSLNIKIAKIVAGALLCAVVLGTAVLGVVTVISAKGGGDI